MNKFLRFFPLCLAILLFYPAPVLSEKITIDSESQFEYAREQMGVGKYWLAVTEFERFINFFPSHQKIPSARYLIGTCYLEGKKFEEARKALLVVIRKHPGTLSARKAFFLMGESYYRQRVWKEAERWFNRSVEESLSPELKNAAIYRLAWCRMQKNNWQEASSLFNRVGRESYLYPKAEDLVERSLDGENLPLKSPAQAGVMAGILPGLGHVYCDRPKDGLIAFLLNGVFIWAAIEAFDNDNNVLGGALVFLELGFYTGNIYSAVNAAHKSNRKVRDDFRNNLQDRINLELFTSKKTPLGLALKYRF